MHADGMVAACCNDRYRDRNLPFIPQQPAALALPAAFLFGLALVVKLLAARERNLDLGAALFIEIELERHERHALTLDGASELVDLAAVQQQFARPFGRMVEASTLPVFRNIGIDEPDLPIASVRVGFSDRGLAQAQRLDLGAGQRDAGLEDLANFIIEARLAIVGDDFDVAVRFGRHASPRIPVTGATY